MKRAENYNQVEIVLRNAVVDGDLVQCADHTTYKCGDFIVMDRLRFGMEQSVEMLKALTEKHFTIFPRYVFSLEIEDYILLIIKIPGMNGKELIPIYKGYHLLSQDENYSTKRNGTDVS
ncbi:MAG: hypothetical protein K5663_00455 [Clostridiales bacterium]|nr:hypothetical protein [Clostridiales bacterium]